MNLDQNFGAGSWSLWFRSGLRSVFANHLISIGTLEWVHKSFRELNDSQTMLRSLDLKQWFTNHYSNRVYSARVQLFDLDRKFGAGSWIFWFRLELWSGFANHFTNWMIHDPRSEVPIWNDTSGLQSGLVNLFCLFIKPYKTSNN